MVAITYDVARVSAGEPAKAERGEARPPRKRFFARLMQAVYESRMRQAQREIARHVHLLPYALDERGNRIARTGAGDMPFGGW